MRSSPSDPDPLDPGPLGFAHRGLHRGPGFPENSFVAFAAALEMGAGIECDLRLTADNRIVVFHDRETWRMCSSHLWVNRSTYAELSRLRVGDGPIPTLESLLELVKGTVPLLLEIKVEGDLWRWMPALKAALRDYRGRHGVMSFDARIGAPSENEFPQVRRGLVIRDSWLPASAATGACARRSRFPCGGTHCTRQIVGRSRTPTEADLQLDYQGASAAHASASSCGCPYLGSRWPTVKPKSSPSSRRA